MKLGVGVLFVAIGLVILWLAVTNRLPRLADAWSVLKGDTDATGQPTVNPVSGPGAAPVSSSLARLSSALNVPAFPVLPVLGFNVSNN